MKLCLICETSWKVKILRTELKIGLLVLLKRGTRIGTQTMIFAKSKTKQTVGAKWKLTTTSSPSYQDQTKSRTDFSKKKSIFWIFLKNWGFGFLISFMCGNGTKIALIIIFSSKVLHKKKEPPNIGNYLCKWVSITHK